VLALGTYLGVERYFGDLLRSDHTPFREAGFASVLRTETADFRNPHYHRPSDTPETLDYVFLFQVTKLALARAAVWAWAKGTSCDHKPSSRR
jgi:hypothetical protein